MRALERLSPSLPTGLFSNARIHTELAQLFSRPGRSNDFRQLKSRLTLVATDLDASQAVAFGRPGWDHVPISKAVQASAALPGVSRCGCGWGCRCRRLQSVTTSCRVRRARL